MQIYPDIGLFRGIAPADLDAVLRCLGAEIRHAAKEEILLLAGDRPQSVGVVLSGLLHVVQEECDGGRSLLAALAPGEIFAEALCCAGVAESPVTVAAAVDSEVLLLRFERILRTCPQACAFHRGLIENLLRLMADKTLFLQSRLEILSLKSVRARVLRYLEALAPQEGRSVAVPFNREGMAEYLCVERSALSHELARMKRDGLLDYRKNQFLLKPSCNSTNNAV